jgi:hypothetical protein
MIFIPCLNRLLSQHQHRVCFDLSDLQVNILTGVDRWFGFEQSSIGSGICGRTVTDADDTVSCSQNSLEKRLTLR